MDKAAMDNIRKDIQSIGNTEISQVFLDVAIRTQAAIEDAKIQIIGLKEAKVLSDELDVLAKEVSEIIAIYQNAK